MWPSMTELDGLWILHDHADRTRTLKVYIMCDVWQAATLLLLGDEKITFFVAVDNAGPHNIWRGYSDVWTTVRKSFIHRTRWRESSSPEDFDRKRIWYGIHEKGSNTYTSNLAGVRRLPNNKRKPAMLSVPVEKNKFKSSFEAQTGEWTIKNKVGVCLLAHLIL